MSCNDVASVLDTHRAARLTPAERAKIDAHLAACTDCSAAWQAQNELLALRVPPLPSALLERALLASRLPQSAPARRARLGMVAGAVLLAGAAAAAVVVSMTREDSVSVPTPAPAPVELSDTPVKPSVAVDELLKQVEVIGVAPAGDGVTQVELVETALSIAPIVRRPPDYPLDALAKRLAGNV